MSEFERSGLAGGEREVESLRGRDSRPYGSGKVSGCDTGYW